MLAPETFVLPKMIVRGCSRDAFVAERAAPMSRDMNLPEQYQRVLLSAQGYCELGMAAEGLVELDALPSEWQQHPSVAEMRLIALMQAKRWKVALTAARELMRLSPEKNIGYIHAAFCLHELGQTEAARQALLAGPQTLHADPIYHYNLACYECRLGQLESARQRLEKTFMIDKKFREFAKTDPDLAALRTD